MPDPAVPPVPRRSLGRGLAALLGDAPPAANAPAGARATDGSVPRTLPIELLRRNPDQPRRAFTEVEIDELAQSIREKGVLQPLLVRPAPGAEGEYQIVAGERRWRAAQKAGLAELPIVVRSDLDDLDVLEIGIIENVQREDLRPLDEAAAYRSLIDRFGRTQDEVAKSVGKSRSHVANALRLLAMPAAVVAALADGRISPGHARAIATAPDAERLARVVVDRGLSVRQAEALGRRASARPDPRPGAAKSRGVVKGVVKDADTKALEDDLSALLGLKVEIDDRDGRGEVRVRYASLEQLDDVCRRLMG